MSPAQLQLALAIIERAASIEFDEYLEACQKSQDLFNQYQQTVKLRDDLRVEAAQVGVVRSEPVEPAPPAGVSS